MIAVPLDVERRRKNYNGFSRGEVKKQLQVEVSVLPESPTGQDRDRTDRTHLYIMNDQF